MAIIQQEEDDKHYLPTEIVIEILLNLPVESLLRCKSVCNSWCSFISDPRFVTSHLNLTAHNNNKKNYNRRLIFSIEYTPNIYQTCDLSDVMNGDQLINNDLEVVDYYPFKSDTERVSVVGSVNGLVCLRVNTMDNPHDDILFNWNPSTRKYYKLPSDAYRTPITPRHFGFGYDESTDDYKVVSVFFNHRFEVKKFIKMYSFRNGSWKDVGASPHSIPSNCIKFLNGAFHWTAAMNSYDHWTPPMNSHDNWTIVSLDLATETFGEVVLPVFDKGEKYLTLGTLGEWLCVLWGRNKIRVDLWAMKVYGMKDSWTKLFRVDYPLRVQFLAPLCILNDGKILLTFDKKIMIYDSKNSVFSEIHIFDKCVEASTYAESLVSPLPPATALGHRAADSNG